MPSQYYQLRGVEGVNGGHFTDPEGGESTPKRRGPSFTDSFNQRIVGSRFQEVNRDSVAYGRLPMGSQVMVEKNGQMGPGRFTDSPLPDAAPYGPGAGHTSWDTAAFHEGVPPHQWWVHQPGDSIQEEPELGEEWVDIMHEAPEAFENAEEYNMAALPKSRPRPPRVRNVQNTEDRRETFPLRERDLVEPEEYQPPHLRVQPRQPFVRPLSGLDHDDLGHIYSDINMWRGKLKAINTEIGEVQRECYNDIADGARIRGWLVVGRGLRFLPGIQLIEGRAKEDIRWDELQNEGGPMRTTAFWSIVITFGILLGICRTSYTSHDAGQVFTYERSDCCSWFNRGFSTGVRALLPVPPTNILGQLSRIRYSHRASCSCGRHAVYDDHDRRRSMYVYWQSAFVSDCMNADHDTDCGQLRNTVSLSGSQLAVFKTVFYLLVGVGGMWLFAVGAVLFAFGALSRSLDRSLTVANGAIYMSAFAMILIVNVAIISPALLMIQPFHLWQVLRGERSAVTPRQRFRGQFFRAGLVFQRPKANSARSCIP